MALPHVSLVLRLLPGPATAGELVGQVEVVDTGERLVIRSVDDLVAIATHLATPQDVDGRRRRTPSEEPIILDTDLTIG